MSDHTVFTVLVISVLIFVFFKFCLGLDNAAGVDDVQLAGADKCPTGQVFSEYSRRCKDLVQSNKSLTQRLLLMMPYFSASVDQQHSTTPSYH